MIKRRRHLAQIQPLEERLAAEAERLRKEARNTPQGIKRERLMRLARQADTAAHISGWLRPPGLQPPGNAT